jgi:hypothetical protein
VVSADFPVVAGLYSSAASHLSIVSNSLNYRALSKPSNYSQAKVVEGFEVPKNAAAGAF